MLAAVFGAGFAFEMYEPRGARDIERRNSFH